MVYCIASLWCKRQPVYQCVVLCCLLVVQASGRVLVWYIVLPPCGASVSPCTSVLYCIASLWCKRKPVYQCVVLCCLLVVQASARVPVCCIVLPPCGASVSPCTSVLYCIDSLEINSLTKVSWAPCVDDQMGHTNMWQQLPHVYANVAYIRCHECTDVPNDIFGSC